MLTLEEYIAKRKKEDKLNEFEIEKRIENIRLSVNYIFEYYDGYLNITDVEHKTILNNERVNKYRQQLLDYDKEVQDWLIGLYDEYSKYMHKNIGSIIDENDVFLLYHMDSEFRSSSYDCYSRLIKKCPFLRDQTEMLYLFTKDYHKVKSSNSFDIEHIPFFTQPISDWMERTQTKFQVNIPAFAYCYVNRFYDNVDKWPTAHKIKTGNEYLPYDYDYKQKKNLFNIDSVYFKVSNKSFIKGRKQELELLMMYFWVHNMELDEEYWEEYSSKVIPTLSIR
jgi:hypothetical protein